MWISELTDAGSAAWDTYVQTSPHGLPQHLSGWRRVLHRTYGYRTPFLLAQEPDTAGEPHIVGVLPLFLVESVLTGRTAMSLPGGLCADHEEAAAALIRRGCELAADFRAGRFVLQDSRHRWPGDLQTVSHHVDWTVDLLGGSDAVWERLDRNIRRQVRMARDHGLIVVVDRSGDLLTPFYRVLSHFTHQAGTPVFSRRFLEEVMAAFPHSFNLAVVFHGSQPIGGYFQLELSSTLYGLWGASLHEFLPLRPVYLAYWALMDDASRRGLTALDMGRSPADSNASRFKGQWGGVCVPVYQQTAAVGNGRGAQSVTAQVQSDGRFRSFMQIWPKLPFPVAQFLGPRLRRHVPFA